MTTNQAQEYLRPIEPVGRVSLLETACIALRAGPETCTVCRDACPPTCIEMDTEGLRISADCLGCGRCAASCPTGALTVKGFAASAPLPSGNVVHIECYKVPVSISGAQALRVPCLGGVSPARWLALAEAAQPRRLIVVDRGWCAGCSAGKGCAPEHPARAALDLADIVLAEAGWSAIERPRIDQAPLPASLMPAAIPADKPASLPRRALFRKLGDIAREATGIAEPPPLDTPRQQRQHGMPTPEREALLTIAERLARARGKAMPSAPFVTLTVAGNCGHHGVCAGVCPTGALAIYENEDAAGLAFDSWRCIGCGLCAKSCPQHTIALAPAAGAPSATEAQILTRHLAKRCRKCLDTFHGLPGQSVCADCQRNDTMARALFGGAG